MKTLNYSGLLLAGQIVLMSLATMCVGALSIGWTIRACMNELEWTPCVLVYVLTCVCAWGVWHMVNEYKRFKKENKQ